MFMDHGLSENSMVATTQARVEWTTSGPRDMYLLYDQAHYLEVFTPGGWWQRTLTLDPHHWFRLSGTVDTSPWEALQAILREPDRPAFTLPALLVALFLAHAAHPDSVEQRQALHWAAAALPGMLTYIPVDMLCSGWIELSHGDLDDMIEVVIDVLLRPELVVPWAFQDGLWAHVLAHLADALWQFPPDAIRQIVSATAMQRESGLTDGETKTMPGWVVLGYLSAIRFWREPWPTVRGVPVQASLRDFSQLWPQVLIIMHPTAPAITDAQFTWLCGGMVGEPYDGPFDQLRVANQEAAFGLAPLEWQERIARLRNEAAQGSCHPSGCWEVLVSSHWPALVAYGVGSMRVVAEPAGCWVRLIPVRGSWGTVLWWHPDQRPPAWWTIAFDQSLSSARLLAFHATLWQIWRSLRIDGCLAATRLSMI